MQACTSRAGIRAGAITALAVVALMGGGHAPAMAATTPLVAHVDNGFLRVLYNVPKLANGDTDLPRLQAIKTPANVTIEAAGPNYVVTATTPELQAGGLCKSLGTNRVRCPIASVTRGQIYVLMGGGNDSVTMRSLPSTTFVAVHGLDGNDRLLGEYKRDGSFAFASADYQLDGNDGADQLVGGPANDYLNGGPGIDSVSGFHGNDRLFTQDGVRDRFVHCGLGADTISADPFDIRSYSSCETRT